MQTGEKPHRSIRRRMLGQKPHPRCQDLGEQKQPVPGSPLHSAGAREASARERPCLARVQERRPLHTWFPAVCALTTVFGVQVRGWWSLTEAAGPPRLQGARGQSGVC